MLCTFAERETALRHPYLPRHSKVWQRKGGGCTRQGRTAVTGGRVGGRCWVKCWVALPLLGPALVFGLRQAAALHPAKPELTGTLPLRVWRRQAFLPATSCGPAPITSLAEDVQRSTSHLCQPHVAGCNSKGTFPQRISLHTHTVCIHQSSDSLLCLTGMRVFSCTPSCQPKLPLRSPLPQSHCRVVGMKSAPARPAGRR